MITDDFNFTFDDSDFPVSIEEFAAYMDGNLADDEMQRVGTVIEHDETMQGIVGQNAIIEDLQQTYDRDDCILPLEFESFDFNIPNITQLEYNSDPNGYSGVESHISDYTEYDVNETNINHVKLDNMSYKNFAVAQASLAARKIYGEDGFGPEGGLNPVIYQGNEGVCAIRSQQIILRDYGIDISLEELKQYAISNGWYDPSPEGGTPMWAIGNLLLSCKVPCEQSVDNTVYDLINELAQGHRVIVGVDANELWADRNNDVIAGAKEWFKDFFVGDTPNHALVVAGVDVNPDNPGDVKVILTDPGQGDLRIEYELDDFMDAWKDSQCFMVSTNNPAPLQYNPETGMEEPSNFAVKEFIETNSIPLSADNIILPGEMAAMCAEPHYSEGHLNTIPVGGHEGDCHNVSRPLEKVQESKSPVAETVSGIGADHYGKDAFVSALKDLFGFGSDDIAPREEGMRFHHDNPTAETDGAGRSDGMHHGGDIDDGDYHGEDHGEEIDTDNGDMCMDSEEL